MKIKNLILVIVLGTGIFLNVSCASKSSQKESDSDDIYNVQVAKLEKQILDNTLEFTANIEAWEKVNLAPASPGRIIKIYAEVGNHIKKGQLLVNMDPTQYNQARLQLTQLQIDYNRMDSLVKVGAISRQQYDQIKTQYDIARNNTEFLEQNVNLKAPFSGVITGKYFENGELFSGAPNTKEGKAAILTLEKMNVLKAYVDIPESYYNNIKLNLPVEIKVDALGDQKFNGKVSQIYPTVDPSSRTFRVEIKIDNPREIIKPGMFARLSINLVRIEALAAPSIAVLKLQGTNKYYIYKVENNIAKQVFIERGRILENYTEIANGNIKEGDYIVVVGQDKLFDGAKLNIINNK